jgi:hypothetical protein
MFLKPLSLQGVHIIELTLWLSHLADKVIGKPLYIDHRAVKDVRAESFIGLLPDLGRRIFPKEGPIIILRLFINAFEL